MQDEAHFSPRTMPRKTGVDIYVLTVYHKIEDTFWFIIDFQ